MSDLTFLILAILIQFSVYGAGWYMGYRFRKRHGNPPPDYRKARGIFHDPQDTEPAEVAIRRLRDNEGGG